MPPTRRCRSLSMPFRAPKPRTRSAGRLHPQAQLPDADRQGGLQENGDLKEFEFVIFEWHADATKTPVAIEFREAGKHPPYPLPHHPRYGAHVRFPYPRILFQQTINGLTLGGIYALIAIGYTMVYGIIGMINFAHGEIYMIGAYVALLVITVLGLFGVDSIS